MEFTIRNAKLEDAQACGTICFEAFSKISNNHNFPPDFPSAEMAIGLLSHTFSRDDLYTTVAEMDGKIVGSNVFWENGEIVGVGPITIDPSVQAGSIGKALMEDGLKQAKSKGYKSVRLVQAAFNNVSLALYIKLGFNVQEPLSAINGPILNISIPGYTVRPALIEDIEACNELCINIHGYHRKGDLSDAIQQETASVVERNGQITGYATQVGYFGHAVAETNEDLKALIGAAQGFAGPGILLPTRNGEMMRWCLDNGLKIIQPLSLMAFGPYNEPKGAFLPSIIF